MILSRDCCNFRRMIVQSSETLSGGMYVPDKISATVEESAVHGITSASGDRANGVTLA